MSTRILALVGSLRSGSDNRRLAEAAVKLAPSGVSVDIFDGLADVALYNEDLDRRGPSLPPTGCVPKFSRPTRFCS